MIVFWLVFAAIGMIVAGLFAAIMLSGSGEPTSAPDRTSPGSNLIDWML